MTFIIEKALVFNVFSKSFKPKNSLTERLNVPINKAVYAAVKINKSVVKVTLRELKANANFARFVFPYSIAYVGKHKFTRYQLPLLFTVKPKSKGFMTTSISSNTQSKRPTIGQIFPRGMK